MDGTQASPPGTQGFRPGQLGSLPRPPPIDLQVQATAAASLPGTEASRPGHQTGTAPFPLDSYTPQVSRTGSSASAPGSDGVSPRLTRLDQLPHPLDSKSRRRQQLHYPAPRPRGPATRLALLPSPALVHHKSQGRVSGISTRHPRLSPRPPDSPPTTPPTRLKSWRRLGLRLQHTAHQGGSPLPGSSHTSTAHHSDTSTSLEGRGRLPRRHPARQGKSRLSPRPTETPPQTLAPHSAENGPSSIGSDESYADPRRCRSPSPSPSSQLSEPSPPRGEP